MTDSIFNGKIELKQVGEKLKAPEDYVEILDIEEPKKEESYVKAGQTVEFSVLNTYGEDITAKTYVTDVYVKNDMPVKATIIKLIKYFLTLSASTKSTKLFLKFVKGF